MGSVGLWPVISVSVHQRVEDEGTGDLLLVRDGGGHGDDGEAGCDRGVSGISRGRF